MAAIHTAVSRDLVADLDAALARRGEDVVLTRGAATKTMRAFVRQYEPKELVEGSGLEQGDTEVIVSATGVADWPVDGAGPGSGGDTRVPRRNDKILIAGVQRTVRGAAPKYDAGSLVRVELQVRG